MPTAVSLSCGSWVTQSFDEPVEESRIFGSACWLRASSFSTSLVGHKLMPPPGVSLVEATPSLVAPRRAASSWSAVDLASVILPLPSDCRATSPPASLPAWLRVCCCCCCCPCDRCCFVGTSCFGGSGGEGTCEGGGGDGRGGVGDAPGGGGGDGAPAGGAGAGGRP